MTKSKKKKNKKSPKTTEKITSPHKATEPSFWKDKRVLLLLFIALVVTFISFSDAMNNTWVSWDDDRNFAENELILNIDGSNFWEYTKKIFGSDVIGGYNPLTNWTFALEKLAWGMEDSSWKWWHLDNILLHLLCVYLVFRIALLLNLNVWGAFLLALLFGIHPMRVESVAWLTERKDVLFASFYFGALYYYIKGKLKGKLYGYIMIIIPLFILSGLSKIQAVSLPLSMIAIDYYLDGKFKMQSIIAKAPYFIISLIIGLIGSYILTDAGVIGTDNTDFNFIQRLFIGAYSYMVYIAKLIYPWQMSPLYPYPSSYKTIYYLSALPLAAIFAAVIYAWKKGLKVWVFGFLFFTVNVMFVLQIVGAGQGFLADRFTYVPYFGFFFIAAYYYQKLDLKTMLGKIITGILALYLLLFCYKTYKQVDVWSNSYSLWTHAIKYYPNTRVTWGNRANWLRDNGYKDLALADYSKRLSLAADDAEPYNSRGKLYFQSNRPDTLQLALADYQMAVKLAKEKQNERPKYRDLLPEYLVNMASTYARLNRNQEAIQYFTEAEQLDKNSPNIYFNRSITYHVVGDYEAEIRDINKYLEFRPYDGAIRINLGTAKRLLGDYDGALTEYNMAQRYTQMPALFTERARNYIAMKKYDLAKQDVLTLQKNGIAIPDDLRAAFGL